MAVCCIGGPLPLLWPPCHCQPLALGLWTMNMPGLSNSKTNYSHIPSLFPPVNLTLKEKVFLVSRSYKQSTDSNKNATDDWLTLRDHTGPQTHVGFFGAKGAQEVHLCSLRPSVSPCKTSIPRSNLSIISLFLRIQGMHTNWCVFLVLFLFSNVARSI